MFFKNLTASVVLDYLYNMGLVKLMSTKYVSNMPCFFFVLKIINNDKDIFYNRYAYRISCYLLYYENYVDFYNHYRALPERPDYDGYLTKPEADAWWRGKSGQPLFVDQSKIELPDITAKNFNNTNGNSFYKTLFGV